MSDLDRLLAQVEELKKLANRPDDGWMDHMSNEELAALGKRVRKVADGLSGLQSQLQRQMPSNPMKPLITPRRAGTSGSLGSIVKRDQGSPAPSPSSIAPPPSSAPRPYQNPFPGRQPDGGADLGNPMQRRRGTPPREAPLEGPRAQHPSRRPEPGEAPPPGRHGGRRPNF
jgi:hypothetical protein